MTTSTAPTTDALSDVVRWRARAEAYELETMLDYRDAEYAKTADVEPTLRRRIERSAIVMTIAENTHMSEGQVFLRLSTADTVQGKTPAVWDAFGDGLIDFARVRDIAAAVDQLQREESIFRLDQTVIGYAVDHTAAELRQWLRRFVRRVEADLAVERAEEERKKRHVSVKHTDDSMAWLNAYSRHTKQLPSRHGCESRPASLWSRATTGRSGNARRTCWSRGAPARLR
jgi:hypothetical protein